ncbi:MAG: sigma-54-dependent Fis family transcriptional regulator [Candidatus Eisenbacteria bacterium]|nr:sigma-54-dependent Fis family transcriptional regulator [Candidatus Eisenbacteria bacterium]
MGNGDSMTRAQNAQTLLIVDDERSLRFSIGEWARDEGYSPLEAAAGREALEAIREQGVDAVLLDLKLGDEDGLKLLKQIRELDPTVPVVMLTGHGTVEHAVRAIKMGAYDFMLKPPDLDHLGVVLERGLEHARLKREVDHLRATTRSAQPIVGDSETLQKALTRLERAAKSGTSTVLIRGETGSGKELMARYLHDKSARSSGPFIELNCSAIPETLLESELYGHERGAFTDAKRFKKGLFELADGGTLFLDEIGEMAPQLQAKLLRVLETRTFRRVGGAVDITVDVRVVAATHRDLPRMVSEGKFREDLYFRLNVVPVEIPALRERPSDVVKLAEHFVARFCRELGRATVRIDPRALALMKSYAWPGNVRELKNVIERVVLLEAEEEILPEHLPVEMTRGAAPSAAAAGSQPFPTGVVRPLTDIEKMAIEHALTVCDGNKTKAAGLLQISRQTLRTKLKEYALGDDAEEAGEGA